MHKQTSEKMEREGAFQAKKEAKEKAESRRKVAKEKMMKKTRHGQPIMKYRREHLLESIEKSAENYGSRTSWPPHVQDNLLSVLVCCVDLR